MVLRHRLVQVLEGERVVYWVLRVRPVLALGVVLQWD